MLIYSMRAGTGASRRQRGLSIVELMVGITVGLFVVAAASMTVATQLSDNRRLLLETQVQQDLRAAADIVARELRRAGYWQVAGTQVATPDTSPTNLLNPRRIINPSSGSTSIVQYEYDRKTGGAAEFRFGFCQGSSCATAAPGAIRARVDASFGPRWEMLTDDKSVNITALTITPINGPALPLVCPQLCAGTDDTSCWPTLTVREVEVTITGQAVSDPAVQRTLTSRVRLRNDLLTLSAPGVGPGNFVPCPNP